MSSTSPTSQLGFLPKYTGVNIKQVGDADISSVANNELLAWNSTKGKWVNTSTITGATISGGSLSGTTISTGSVTLTGTGAAKICGTATLATGTVTVATTAVATGDLIFVSCESAVNGTTTGNFLEAPTASIVDGTSFVINSVDAAGAVVTTDTSTVNWFIVHPSS